MNRKMVSVPIYNPTGTLVGWVPIQSGKLTHAQTLALALNRDSGGWIGVKLMRDNGRWIIECTNSNVEMLKEVENFKPEILSVFYSRKELDVLRKAQDIEDTSVILIAERFAHGRTATVIANIKNIRDVIVQLLNMNLRLRSRVKDQEKFIGSMESLEEKRAMSILEVDGQLVHVSTLRDRHGKPVELTVEDQKFIADIIRAVIKSKNDAQSGQTKSVENNHSDAGSSLRDRVCDGSTQ